MTLLDLLQDDTERKKNVAMAHDILKMHDLTVAEDVVATVYLDLLALNPVTKKPPQHLLHFAVKRRCIDVMRNKKAESDPLTGKPMIEFRPLHDLPDAPTQEPNGEVRLLQRDVQKAVAQLTPQERYVAEQLLMGCCPGDAVQVCRELGMASGQSKGGHSKMGGTFVRLMAGTKRKLRALLSDYQPV